LPNPSLRKKDLRKNPIPPNNPRQETDPNVGYAQVANEYRKQAVNGASPLQLVIMLYDGALRFMEAGKHAIVNRDLQRQNDNLQRAQRIVLELLACLDMDKGGEIAKNLFAIYTYVVNELVEANVNDDAAAVDRCRKIFSDLRSSWVQIEQQVTPTDAEYTPLAA